MQIMFAAAVVETVAPAPVSSDEGADDAAAMEATMDPQTEEQIMEEERETGDAPEMELEIDACPMSS